MYMYECIHVCVRRYDFCMDVRMSACLSVCTHVYMHANMYLRMYGWTSLCMHVGRYVCNWFMQSSLVFVRF